MIAFFSIVASMCVPAGGAPAALGFFIPGMLLAGAAGSAVHCVPMCGPLVLGQASDCLARMPAEGLSEGGRLRAGLLLPYHLGRLTTYAMLGAVGGFGGAALLLLPWLGRISGVLLLFAASLFLLQAVRPSLGGLARPWSGNFGFAKRMRKLAPRSRYLMGFSLGFLPCGFLYGALATAAASGSALSGALAMAAFGLGTVPALALVGIAGGAAGRFWHRGLARARPLLLGANAIVLCALGLRVLLT